MDTSSSSSDFIQWLHAMKMVARLPGGMPPEFRRKLWLALAEQHLQTVGIDWAAEESNFLCEHSTDDDEELGIQIVKDLHRTGSSLFSGPAGSLNQAKLKRVLLGYARWNPEVGYCQGFNMLGALILQVMDKNDMESLKIMIFLIEGILPNGYFSGSLGGLQADMAVFREILAVRLPNLSKHLQKLQGLMGDGGLLEPPLTNVFTMQWFLTLFCTCLPINCVLRVWDLVLIEGSDVLLRTALAIWGLLEDRILAAKTADEFYCKMGMLSGELLNGHLFDSNGLIQKVVDLGPIPELQKLRDKHLCNITPWRDKRGLRLFFSDDDGDSDDDARLAVTAAWSIRLGRRGSFGLPTTSNRQPEVRERIALDITLLKKQYEKLKERQRQAHIILTNTARQTVNPQQATSSVPINQYLIGRNAILSNKGRRIGPPPGSIPPVRKVKANVNKSVKTSPKQIRQTTSGNGGASSTAETLHWKDADMKKRTSAECTSVDLNSEEDYPLRKSTSISSSLSSSISETSLTRSRKKSESSSYSEDSDGNSSTSTSLCDDDNLDFSVSSIEASPLRKPKISANNSLVEDTLNDLAECMENLNKIGTPDSLPQTALNEVINLEILDESRDEEKTTEDIHFLTSLDNTCYLQNCDEKENNNQETYEDEILESVQENQINVEQIEISEVTNKAEPSKIEEQTNLRYSTQQLDVNCSITSTSQLSPIADISKYLSNSSISPLRTPSSFLDDYENISKTLKPTTVGFRESDGKSVDFKVSEEGVTNQYFERINAPERPNRLDLKSDLQIDYQTNQTSFDIPRNALNPPTIPSITKITGMNATEDIELAKQSIEEFSEEIYAMDMVTDKAHFLREKSYSLDEQSSAREEYRPSSCPEHRSEKKHNEKVLRIIEENSMILHRILNKGNNPADADIPEKEAGGIEDTESKEKIIPNKLFTFDDKSELKISKTIEVPIDDKIPTPLRSEEATTEFKEYNFDNILKDAKAIIQLNFDESEIKFISEDQTDASDDPLDDSEKSVKSDERGKYEQLLDNSEKSSKSDERSYEQLDNFEKSDKSEDCTDEKRYSLIDIICSEKSKSEKQPDASTLHDELLKSVSEIDITTVQQRKQDESSEFYYKKIVELISDSEKDSNLSTQIIDIVLSDMNRDKSEMFGDNKQIEVAEKTLDLDMPMSLEELSTLLPYLSIDKFDDNDLCSSKIKCYGSENQDDKSDKTEQISLAESIVEPSATLSSITKYDDETDILLSKRKLSDDLLKSSEFMPEQSKQTLPVITTTDDNLLETTLLQQDDLTPIKRNISSDELATAGRHQEVSNIILDKTKRTFNAELCLEKKSEDSDLSATLSSIQNTIDTIDSLCQDHGRRNLSGKRRDEKITSATFFDTSNLDSSDFKKRSRTQSEDRRLLSNMRFSRDKYRDVSPRRRRDDEREEYESYSMRNLSPAMSKSDVFPQRSTGESTERKYMAPDYSIPKYLSNLESYTAYADEKSKKDVSIHSLDIKNESVLPKTIYSDKLEIRHTTVTSTFYDRFMSHKKERNVKHDKSPSSPIFSKSYLDSLKPPSTSTYDRNSKSAEHSPARNLCEEKLLEFDKISSTILTDSYRPLSVTSPSATTSVRSCDNIPAQLYVKKHEHEFHSHLPHTTSTTSTPKPPHSDISHLYYVSKTPTTPTNRDKS